MWKKALLSVKKIRVTRIFVKNAFHTVLPTLNVYVKSIIDKPSWFEKLQKHQITLVVCCNLFHIRFDKHFLYVQWLKYKQSLMKILKITLILGKIWGANTSSFWKETKLWVFRDCLVLEYCTSIHLPPFGVPEKSILIYKFPSKKL